MKAGSCTVDITPPLGVAVGTWGLRTGLAEGVDTPLKATAVVIGDDRETVALVGVDLVFVSAQLVAEVRDRVHRLTGIAHDAVMVAASHNHAGPRLSTGAAHSLSQYEGFENYARGLPDTIAGAVYAAFRHRMPARLGVGVGSLEGIAVNRVDRTRPVDGRVWVVRIDDSAGRAVAAIVSFACHPVTIGGETLCWDADYPGPLRDALCDRLGVRDCLFLQGSAGDVAPWDYWFGNPAPRPHGSEARDDLANALSDSAVEVARQIVPRATDVRYLARTVSLPRRRVPWTTHEIASAKRARRAVLEPSYGEVWGPNVHTTVSAQLHPDYYAGFFLSLFEELIRQDGMPMEAELHAFRLGEHTILCHPFELFTQCGRQIDASYSDDHLCLVGYSNDYLGYLPAPSDYDVLDGMALEDYLDQERFRWAYGITTTTVARAGSAKFVDECIRLAGQLRAGGPQR